MSKNAADRKERSEACRSWIDNYGREFRMVKGCGRRLSKLDGARGNRSFSSTVSQCAWELGEVMKRPGAIDGVGAIASCVRQGFSHGVTQSTWKPKKRKA
jgi:hypothetical protein